MCRNKPLLYNYSQKVDIIKHLKTCPKKVIQNQIYDLKTHNLQETSLPLSFIKNDSLYSLPKPIFMIIPAIQHR